MSSSGIYKPMLRGIDASSCPKSFVSARRHWLWNALDWRQKWKLGWKIYGNPSL